MPSKRVEQLKLAYSKKLVVSYWSPYSAGSETGYVLDIGPEFILIARIDDGMRFDGFICVRIADLRRLQVPARYEKFYIAALRKRKEVIAKKPNINLENIQEILQSANQLFPLVTIHREKLKPRTCRIGRIVDVTSKHVSLLEIGPDAMWEAKPTVLNLADTTRVDLGGSYEEALYLVGGEPHKLKRKKK